jgi:hypothetical protein
MIGFDEGAYQQGRYPHPLNVVGNDNYEIAERRAFISRRLEILRDGRDATELAKVAKGVSARTMQGLFDHPEKASPETVSALCEVLGVDISCIRGYADPMTPEELEALYMDDALTDEDRRIVCETLQHIHRIRKPPRIRLQVGEDDPNAVNDWHTYATQSGIEEAEKI